MHLIHDPFESVFRALFDCMIGFLPGRNCNVFVLWHLLCGQMPLCEMARLKFY